MKIDRFLGLNENPDGDTTLKAGELSVMRNFRITQDQHLQVRPGTKTVLSLLEALEELTGETYDPTSQTLLHGVWRGDVGSSTHLLAAYGGHIFDVDLDNATATDKGTITEDKTQFFGFDNKVYVLNGHEYKAWDGGANTTFQTVTGYVPLIQTATTPAGSGTALQNVNRLTNKRRVKFSPDGTATEFHLPEDDITAVTDVKGTDITYTADTGNGTLTFASAPTAGTNTLEVTYTKGTAAASEVTGMYYAELFNGANDTRVFLYGDGTNKTIYSGIEFESGNPSAEYFPDLYEALVGESNTPITALVRHYSRMMAFKPNSAWVIQDSSLTLNSGIVTSAFYVQPVNRQFGNDAMGKVKLLENNPLTFDVDSVYQWTSSGSYSGYVTSSENNAKRISDRVAETLQRFDWNSIETANMKGDHEFWIMQNGIAVILNYANNSWYFYDHLPFSLLLEVESQKYGLCNDGRIVHFSRQYRNDDGSAISCYAATGSMDFGKDWVLKYSPMIFVSMQPESAARAYVTVESNKRSDYPEKIVAYGLATYLHADFNHWSFGTNRKPQVRKVKIKVKKATYYKLIFKSNSASSTATILKTDVKLRYAGDVK